MYLRGLHLARNYLPRQFLHCAFSTAEQKFQKPKGLSDSAQKAIWAQHIIQSIMTLPPPKSIKDKSLREKIIELKFEKCVGYQLNDDNRKEVMKMFTEGIYINQNVYDQVRVKIAKDTDVVSTKSKPLIFCPNHATTSHIFKILNEPSRQALIYGGYGISKTMGIIMFSHLVLFKSKFMMQAKNDPDKMNELQYLTELKLIDPTRTAKCWYWSINQKNLVPFQNSLKEKLFFRNLLLNQAVELQQNQISQLQKIESYKQFSTKLLSIYRDAAKIPQRVIFDQINTVASKMRDYNSIIYEKQKILQQFEEKNKQRYNNNPQESYQFTKKVDYIKQIYQQKLKSKSQIKQSVKKMLKYIEQFKIYGKFIFNSSVNFQLDYLKRQNPLSKDMLTFDVVGYHDAFSFQKIQYQEKLITNQGRIDFYHFFWFQIMRLILDRNVPQQTLENIKQKIYKTLDQEIKVKRYYRIIFIIELLLGYSNKINLINENTPQQKILEILNQIIRNFDKKCKDKTTQSIKNFIYKRKVLLQRLDEKNINRIVEKIDQKFKEGDQKPDLNQIIQFQPFNNYNLIILLYDLAENDIRVGNKVMRYSIQLLEDLMGQSVIPIITSKLHNNQFLPVDFQNDSKTINFLWDPEQFRQIVQNVVQQKKKDFFSEVWNKRSLKFNKISKSNRGTSIQLTFLQVLIPKTIIQFHIFTHYKKMQANQNKYKPELYQTYQIQVFQTLYYPTLTKDANFFQNMGQILQKSKKYPDHWFCGRPKKKNAQEEQQQKKRQQKKQQKQKSQYMKQIEHDSFSPSIDFLFVRYNKQKQIHQIQTFDMTIGFDVINKRTQFKQLFNEIVKNKINCGKNTKVSIIHNILCHADEMRPLQQISLPIKKKEKQNQLEQNKKKKQKEKKQQDKKQKETNDTPNIQSQTIPQVQTFLIDNKIQVCFSCLDKIRIKRCFDSAAYKTFKYFHKWVSNSREQQLTRIQKFQSQHNPKQKAKKSKKN